MTRDTESPDHIHCVNCQFTRQKSIEGNQMPVCNEHLNLRVDSFPRQDHFSSEMFPDFKRESLWSLELEMSVARNAGMWPQPGPAQGGEPLHHPEVFYQFLVCFILYFYILTSLITIYNCKVSFCPLELLKKGYFCF